MADFSFVLPPWLKDQDTDSIHARMMANLPQDIDDTEGGFPWDFTRPTALEKAELLEFQMVENVRAMFYQFAGGVYLDYHAEAAGLVRKPPVRATGTVKVTGTPGTDIPEGFLFAVPADGDIPAIPFAALESVTILDDGVAEIPVRAVDAGTVGNVKADTIVIMASNTLTGIRSVTNEEATSGGAETEEDDELRYRIAEVYASKGTSFIGNDADYERWALEVETVGAAIVVPEWNGPGTVAVVVVDRTGFPADQTILDAVYEHIISPNDRMKRLAPIGATLTVKAPEILTVDVSCKLSLSVGAAYAAVYETLRQNIMAHFLSASGAGVVRYAEIGAIIIRTDGVEDYDELKLNGTAANIAFSYEQFPVLGELETGIAPDEGGG